MTSAYEHIVWDWNGTLLGDSGALIAATIDAFQACGLPPITRADYRRHHTQPIPLFYERLAGRVLSDEEQENLDRCFRTAYARHRSSVALTADAEAALRRWAGTGRTQSLLSMYPHDALVPLVRAAGIAAYFTRIDGSVGAQVAYKAPHLSRHLDRLGVRRERVLLVGDSVDDARAAAQCGVACVLYHAGDAALHAREHLAELGVPIAATLEEAVTAWGSAPMATGQSQTARAEHHAATGDQLGASAPMESGQSQTARRIIGR